MHPPGGCEHGESDVQRTQGEQAQLAIPTLTSKPLANHGTPVATRMATMVISQIIVEQVNARVLPNRARNQLRAFDIRPHDSTIAALLQRTLRRNTRAALAADGTVAELLFIQERLRLHLLPLGGWKSSTCSA